MGPEKHMKWFILALIFCFVHGAEGVNFTETANMTMENTTYSSIDTYRNDTTDHVTTRFMTVNSSDVANATYNATSPMEMSTEDLTSATKDFSASPTAELTTVNESTTLNASTSVDFVTSTTDSVMSSTMSTEYSSTEEPTTHTATNPPVVSHHGTAVALGICIPIILIGTACGLYCYRRRIRKCVRSPSRGYRNLDEPSISFNDRENPTYSLEL